MKTSVRPPGASTSAPLRAGNGSAGWPSMGHDLNFVVFYFECDDIAVAAIDEANLRRLVDAHRNIQHRQPVMV